MILSSSSESIQFMLDISMSYCRWEVFKALRKYIFIPQVNFSMEIRKTSCESVIMEISHYCIIILCLNAIPCVKSNLLGVILFTRIANYSSKTTPVLKIYKQCAAVSSFKLLLYSDSYWMDNRKLENPLTAKKTLPRYCIM